MPVDDESGELDTEGLSDSEIDGYIKSAEEVKITSDMWMALNGEFMKELEGEASVLPSFSFFRRSYVYCGLCLN